MTKTNKHTSKIRCEVETKATAELNTEIQAELQVPDKSISELIEEVEETDV